MLSPLRSTVAPWDIGVLGTARDHPQLAAPPVLDDDRETPAAIDHEFVAVSDARESLLPDLDIHLSTAGCGGRRRSACPKAASWSGTRKVASKLLGAPVAAPLVTNP